MAYLAMSKKTTQGLLVMFPTGAFLVTRDENDPLRRLFVQVKKNLAEAPGLAFRVQSKALPNGINAPYGEFENGTVSITAGEAIGDTSRTDDRSALDEAKEFLTVELGSGPGSFKDLRYRAGDVGDFREDAAQSEKAVVREGHERRVSGRMGFQQLYGERAAVLPR